ncbi:MAG TPA: proline dehydrogenase family protein [Acidimicrobiia bacterium]|nr:proline dehydrogenase family protein [Acidimicrobiia bacterium]
MRLFTRSVVAAAGSAPIRRLVTGTRAGRALASRFVAGETLDQAMVVAKRLNRENLLVSLDLLGEEVTEPGAVEAAIAGYERCLARIASDRIAGNISIKLTQLGLAFDHDRARRGLERLANAASHYGLTVTIDMEDSRYTEATVDLYRAVQPASGNLGIALQAYLQRSRKDLEALVSLGGHIRLCKGAYVEPEEIAWQSKAEVDRSFADLLETLMAAEVVKPAIATHDRQLIDLARNLAKDRRGPFEFQMLYGVRPALQRQLVGAGFQVRIYVPYGVAWYPYLVRRLAERPANVGFFVRSLVAR